MLRKKDKPRLKRERMMIWRIKYGKLVRGAEGWIINQKRITQKMSFWQTLISYLPEVAGPTQKRLSFKEKLKWTMIILVIYFVLGLMPLFGLGQNTLQNFEFLSIVLASPFGSIISLGIGPIVTASIVLQLLNGSGICTSKTVTRISLLGHVERMGITSRPSAGACYG